MRDRNAPLSAADADTLAWDKMDGLLPAIVADAASGRTLMLGYMDRAALAATFASGFVTFYSRSKRRLWRKGETSGDTLALRAIHADCDADALLIRAVPAGPTCHLGSPSCFGGAQAASLGFLGTLAARVDARAAAGDQSSYTVRLLAEGPVRIAQKVGEEGVEVALAAVTGDAAACVGEVADLVYHLTVLMKARGVDWADVAALLDDRATLERREG